MIYAEKIFNIGQLKGISAQTITEHLGLYKGYVKHTNLIFEKIKELETDFEKNGYLIGELRRRLAFEFDGMRNHEIYFSQFEGSATSIDKESDLYEALVAEFGSFEVWLDSFKKLALTRGIGWAMLYVDDQSGKLINSWVDEQHLHQLAGLKSILALDMWEHSYMFDVPPSEKKKYIEAFFENLNWKVVEEAYKNS